MSNILSVTNDYNIAGYTNIRGCTDSFYLIAYPQKGFTLVYYFCTSSRTSPVWSHKQCGASK